MEEAERFINVSTSSFLNPFHFSQMRKACEVITRAQRNKEKVLVSGDYDADGITALALLVSTLKGMGLDVMHYLPTGSKKVMG